MSCGNKEHKNHVCTKCKHFKTPLYKLPCCNCHNGKCYFELSDEQFGLEMIKADTYEQEKAKAEWEMQQKETEG